MSDDYYKALGEIVKLTRENTALREDLANLGTYNYQLNAQYERMCESYLAVEQRNSELSVLLSRAQKICRVGA